MKYRVKHISEEGPCEYCGSPIYVGDVAHEGKHGIFCCKVCMKYGDNEFSQESHRIWLAYKARGINL